MQLFIDKKYKHKEIKRFLSVCPFCQERGSFWSQIINGNLDAGKEGLECTPCQFAITFSFQMDKQSEIIDAYMFHSMHLGHIEFRNEYDKFGIYQNNIFIKYLLEDYLDLNKYEKLLLLA